MGVTLWNLFLEYREGFCSRLDTSVSGQVSGNHSDTSTNNEINGDGNDQPQANNLQAVQDEPSEQSEPRYEENYGRNDLGDDAVEDIGRQGSSAHEEDCQEQLSENDVFIQRGDGTDQSLNGNSQENIASEQVETLLNGSGEHNNVQEAGEEISGQSERIVEESYTLGSSDHTENYDIIWPESAAQMEQLPEHIMETEERDSQQVNVEYHEWRDGIREVVDENWLGITSNHQELGNEDMEQAQLQQALEEWHEDNGFQEAVQHWLEGPSGSEAVPDRRVDTVYFPDDDNVYSVELRELLNRYEICHKRTYALKQFLMIEFFTYNDLFNFVGEEFLIFFTVGSVRVLTN